MVTGLYECTTVAFSSERCFNLRSLVLVYMFHARVENTSAHNLYLIPKNVLYFRSLCATLNSQTYTKVTTTSERNLTDAFQNETV